MAGTFRRSLRKGLHIGLYHLEKPADKLWGRVKRLIFTPRPPEIVAYRGYGNARELRVSGRVLERSDHRRPSETDTLLQNVGLMVRRFFSNEAAGVAVRGWYPCEERAQPKNTATAVSDTVSDEEGYFRLALEPECTLPSDDAWHEVHLTIPGQPKVVECPVLVPPVDTEFIVVSDVDDTILQTGATKWLKMVRVTLTRNAWTRLPFEGVAAFYRALQKGSTGTAHNPIFYVSSSPWNLYDFLTDFLNVHAIPLGPLFLRDLGIDRNKFISLGHHAHKLTQIERLIQFYTDLPVILIGDSGQDDPEIYRRLALQFPHRVRAVYIRDVLSGGRSEQLNTITAELAVHGVEMICVPDTTAAAEHALAKGFIRTEELPNIRAEKAKDAQAPPS